MKENKNIRNAGRKLKYGEETERVVIICPVSKKEGLKNVAKEYLSQFVGTKESEHEPEINDSNPIVECSKGVFINNSFACGCYIESGLLKRSKGSKCIMSKSEHNNK